MMFMGLTIANIVGVPLGTLLGQQAGWRATFLVVAAVGVLAFAAIIRWVPNHGKPQTPSLRGELSVFRLPQIWLALLIVIFGFGGVFACLSYISPILTGVSGYSPGEVILLLSLAGAGMTTGNFLGGRLADRLPSLSLYGALVALTAVLTTFTLTAHSKPGAAITLFFVGLTGFTLAPIMQARIMAKADGSPSLVSAAVQSAFNIANSMGAYVGGVVIAGGLGLLAPNLAGAVMAVTGLIIAVFSGVLDQRARARARIHDEESPAHEQREELVAC
jgi:DHA1 family inner membrane transport protein